MRRPLLTLAPILLGASAGCSAPCETSGKLADAGAPPSASAPSPPPPPRGWSLAPIRGRHGVALPENCRMRAPPLRAAVAGTTRFVADARTLGALVVADVTGDPPRMQGVAALGIEPAGSTAVSPIPWYDPAAMPRLAHAGGGAWIAAWGRPLASGSSRLVSWKGGEVEELGEGDGLEAVDLACGETRCALLSTRQGRVMPPGAEVRFGSPSQPVASWSRVEIVPDETGSDAYPVALAYVGGGAAPDQDAAPARHDAARAGDGGAPADAAVVAAIVTRGDVAFWRCDRPSGPERIARLRAPHGVLDVVAGSAPLALAHGSALDEQGCSANAPKLYVERSSGHAAEIALPAPPSSGSLRSLARGTLATWLAPLGCGAARQVVYALVLGDDGSPTSDVMAIADGTSFAVAARGEDVDLWIQLGETVTWVRASCGAPALEAEPAPP